MLYCTHGGKHFSKSSWYFECCFMIIFHPCTLHLPKKAWHHGIRGFLSLPFSRLKKPNSFSLSSQCKCLAPNHLDGSVLNLLQFISLSYTWGPKSGCFTYIHSTCERTNLSVFKRNKIKNHQKTIHGASHSLCQCHFLYQTVYTKLSIPWASHSALSAETGECGQ